MFVDYVALDKQCSREEVEKKYMLTKDEFKKKMKDKPNSSEEYRKFFNEEVNGHLAGYWESANTQFYGVGINSKIWLAGGVMAGFAQDKCLWDYGTPFCGYSGRLLKN